MRSTLLTSACISVSLLALSCGEGNNGGVTSDTASAVAADTKTDTMSTEWISLFDGKSLAGWHGFNRKGDTVRNWTIEDSSLVCLGAAKDAHGGDIVTDDTFDNFELAWDWKINKGSNSGVMYHVVEDPKYKAPYETGPEYQMIDDIGFPEKLEDWQKTGADYAMTVANTNKKTMPVGEWNTSRIVFNKGHVEHWLNGEKIVEFDAWNDEWNRKKTTGKWKDYPDYGSAKSGGIALQDHGNKVYFKNIRVRRL